MFDKSQIAMKPASEVVLKREEFFYYRNYYLKLFCTDYSSGRSCSMSFS